MTSEEEIDSTEIRAELRCEERRKKGRYETETRTLPDGRRESRQVWREYWETEMVFSANPQASDQFISLQDTKGSFCSAQTFLRVDKPVTAAWMEASHGL